MKRKIRDENKQTERNFVDLVFTSKHDFEEMFDKFDTEHHMKKHLENKVTTFNLENLTSSIDERYVIIRGAAGIGKSYTTKQIELLWAYGEIFKEIKYLFHFKCRDINSWKVKTIEELLLQKYQDLFQIITFEELSKDKDKIVIVVDGIDELVGISDFENISKGVPVGDLLTGITQCLFDILLKKEGLLNEAFVIVSARPESCSMLIGSMDNTIKVKCVDILGFSPEAVEKYIKTYLENHGVKDVENSAVKIKEKLNSKVGLKAMMRIPVLLRIICELCVADKDCELPDTVTELYILQLSSFLTHHFRPDGHGHLSNNQPIYYVFNDNKIKSLIPSLAKMCYDMLERDKVVFNKYEVSEYALLDLMLKTGMIMKMESEEGDRYQFFHLTFMEFLASVHLLLTIESFDEIEHQLDKIKGVLPYLCGLAGTLIKDTTSPKKTQIFVESLPLNSLKVVSILQEMFVFISFINGGVVSWTAELFLYCYYECHNKLDMNNMNVRWNIQCHLDIHLQHLLYFIDNQVIQDTQVNNINCKELLFGISEKLIPCLNEKQIKKLVSYILVNRYCRTYSKTMNIISPSLLEQLKLGKHLLDTFDVEENECPDFKWLPYIKYVIIKICHKSEYCNLLVKLGGINATAQSEGQVHSVHIYSSRTFIDETQLLILTKRLQFVPEICLNFVDIVKLDIDKFKLKLENLAKQGQFKTRELILLVPKHNIIITPRMHDFSSPFNSHHFKISNNGDITLHVKQL